MEEEIRQVSIEIREAFCRRCGECVEACPQVKELERPVLQGSRGEVARVAHPENCILCYSCVEICRGRAISVEGARRVPLTVQDAEVLRKIRGGY
jgi:NAD-dependent dihydropyrimidine dehydrogenase PreA subunit